MESKIKMRFAQIRQALEWPVFLFDYQGHCIESNRVEKVGEQVDLPDMSGEEMVQTGSFHWVRVGDPVGKGVYYIAVRGVKEHAEATMKLIRLLFEDQTAFDQSATKLRTLLLSEKDTTHEPDALEEMGLQTLAYRAVLLRFSGNDAKDVQTIIENIADNLPLVQLDQQTICILYHGALDELTDFLQVLHSEIATEIMTDVHFGVGSEVEHAGKVWRSYHGAQQALQLGLALTSEQTIYVYDKMMMYVMVDTLPPDERARLYKEYGRGFQELIEDEELIQTAIQFFDNNLNITETSRNLYVHRNTLIYRLNKIHKVAGLDLRTFEDAIRFYFLLLLWKKDRRA